MCTIRPCKCSEKNTATADLNIAARAESETRLTNSCAWQPSLVESQSRLRLMK